MAMSRYAGFEPLFVSRVASKHRKDYVVVKDLTQLSALSNYCDDPDIRITVNEEIKRKQGAFFLRNENPCHEANLFFHGYQCYEEDGEYKDHDLLDGDMVDKLGYKVFDAGRLVGRRECRLVVKARCWELGICVMMCAARDFHGLVSYQWHKNGQEIFKGEHGIHYAAGSDDCTCIITGPRGNVFSTFNLGSFNSND